MISPLNRWRDELRRGAGTEARTRDEAIDLSEKELKTDEEGPDPLQSRLRAAIKDTVINDRLPNPDIRELWT
jgi:hypothetical protein